MRTAGQVIERSARQWVATRPSVAGQCIAATILAKAPADVTAMLGEGWLSERDRPRPHVWIPDSSLWLVVADSRSGVAPALPGQTVSVASSPVVLALRSAPAQALELPQRTLSWTDAIDAFARPDVSATAGHPEWAAFRIAMVVRSHSTAGLAATLAVRIAQLRQTVLTGFVLLPNTMNIGLREFSDGGDRWRKATVSSFRSDCPRRTSARTYPPALVGTAPSIVAGGKTPLYDMVYAAFKHGGSPTEVTRFW